MKSAFKVLLTFFTLLLGQAAFAQYETAYWPLNYTSVWQILKITDHIEMDTLPAGDIGFIGCASMADAQGNLLCYSYGMNVLNRTGHVMENSCCVCQSPQVPSSCDDRTSGTPHTQGVMILPKPGYLNQYYLINKDNDSSFNGQPLQVNIHTIDLNYNNGLGKVTRKNFPILNDILSDSRMTACQHANGRDWWLVNHQYLTNRIYTNLLSLDTVYGPYYQDIGLPGLEPDYAGYSLFSPDGKTFATVTQGMGGITLLDFDRCSGTFSNFRSIPIIGDTIWYNLAFSPNSRFLYAADNLIVQQFDLQDSDILNSSVRLVFDTNRITPGFSSLILMPDKRIYMGGWNGLDPYLSVIDSPDLKAPNCNFHMRSIFVDGPAILRAVPNFPTYHLGPVLGSGCDTATIDSIPEVIPTGEEQIAEETKGVTIYPNPTQSTVSITATEPIEQISITNLLGQIVFAHNYNALKVDLSLAQLPPGIYLVQVNGVMMKRVVRE